MSRIPPKMEQKAAIKAKVYHVLPVSANGKVYSVETLAFQNGKGQLHEVICQSDRGKEVWRTRIYERKYEPMLETDVQDVFVVDLYLQEEKLVVKLEYHEPIALAAANGQPTK